MTAVRMILLIDNFDSFVHNLARYLRRLGQETRVVRNTEIDAVGTMQLQPQAIVLSPGPCTPTEAGSSLQIVRELSGQIPILGVCLGHQTIGAAFGMAVVRAPEPIHGRTSQIRHNERGVFRGLANPLTVGRYHSLVVDPRSLPDDLEVTAQTDDGVVMAVAHRRLPVIGVQFHPESILTQGGYELLANFLQLAGIEPAGMTPTIDDERRPDDQRQPTLPTRPVTF
jgi:anthranilate synthase/aminodeoxychorismate synthase-like glutamine amidotransferase